MGKKTVAYIAPFGTFTLFTALNELLDGMHLRLGGLEPRYLLFPVQTIACALVLARFWPEYRFRTPRMAWAWGGAALLVFALWIFPQEMLAHTRFHLAPRLEGFDPGTFATHPLLYWMELVMRFIRLVVIVPPLEELFWRGFLLRFLINEEFDAVPFGSYTRMANGIVAIGFMLEHHMPDYPAALAAGLLYNWVAFRTRSLSSCIMAHALTNALLGWYIMVTHQWGFW